MDLDPTDVAEEIAALLEELGVPYVLGGSLASTLHGEPRATVDADFVVDLEERHVEPIAQALEGRYYVDSIGLREAILERRMSNLIHVRSGIKVDLCVRRAVGHDGEEYRRAVLERLKSSSSRAVRVASPEDIVLQKLVWYRGAGEVSDRQWRDVLGVLKVQAGRLDERYMERWSEELGVPDLLARARIDASGEGAG